MEDAGQAIEGLSPLPYHLTVVSHLKQEEPEVWAWASSVGAQAQHLEDLRTSLLRETYRLTPESHPDAYARCGEVMAKLGIEASATLYQAGAGDMNAALVYAPGEVHMVLHGPILERLSSEEFVALLGHELSHYRLWSRDGGDFHTASRILDHTMADPGAAASHVQTARLYSLHTEIYADRGAAFAAGSAAPAISTLVKVQTGLQSVDPAGYLKQAEELEGEDAGVSEARSHPETYLRAQAVDKWWRKDPELDAWMRRRLQGPLTMERLDLADQVTLTGLTRRFIARFLADESLRSEAVLAQVRAYFPDWKDDEPVADTDELTAERIAPSVRDYLGYVMLDLALVDPDLRDHALLEAAKTARVLGGEEGFVASLRKDAGLTRRDVDALTRKLKAVAA